MNNELLVYPGGSVAVEGVLSLDVDAEKGFTPLCPDELPVPEGDEIVEELNKQATFAQKRAASKDAHPPGAYWEATEELPQLSPVEGYPNIDVRWNRHCPVGEKGHELIDGLPHMSQYDFWAIKGTEKDMHPYGACYQDAAKKISTGLIEWARVNGITTVIVGGLATEFCVRETVMELLTAGFNVILNLGGARGIFPDMINAALKEMREFPGNGAIIINSADELQLA